MRDRVTDVAFLGRLMPQVQRPALRPQPVAAGDAEQAPQEVGTAMAPAPVQRAPAPASAAERALAPVSACRSLFDCRRRPQRPCPCGSGLKYRQCHGKKPDAQA
jgi:hypothetical protein